MSQLKSRIERKPLVVSDGFIVIDLINDLERVTFVVM